MVVCMPYNRGGQLQQRVRGRSRRKPGGANIMFHEEVRVHAHREHRCDPMRRATRTSRVTSQDGMSLSDGSDGVSGEEVLGAESCSGRAARSWSASAASENGSDSAGVEYERVMTLSRDDPTYGPHARPFPTQQQVCAVSAPDKRGPSFSSINVASEPGEPPTRSRARL